MNLNENPFSRLKARWLFIYAFLLLIISFLITATLWPAQVAEGKGALPKALMGLIWDILILLLLIYAGWRANLDWPKLVGKPPSLKLLLRLIPMTIPLIAISVGTFHLAFYALSFVAPTWVQSVLRQQWEMATDLIGGIGPHRSASLAINAVLVVVLAPITEELFFRGYLFHRWSLKWGTERGIVLSSAVFGLLHMEDFLGAFAFAWVVSALYVETGSLLITIAIHSMYNLFAMISILLESVLADRAGPPTILEFRAEWWFGAVGLAVGVPWLIRFFRSRWGLFSGPLPYSR